MEESVKNTVNVIDLILAKQAEEFEEAPKSSKTPQIITADNFFTEDNPKGIMSKQQFWKLVKPQTKRELIAFDSFLTKLKNGENVEANPYESLDDEGRSHLWATFRQRKGSNKYKVLTAGSFCLFIGLYQAGLVTCDFTLTSLYLSAEK
ncbi:MAG: hypothetical protein JWR38_1956 [Mucilaginibacter sp.]|nr:hypothetical protein [Mucilaginibacter sp.]